MSNTSSNPRDPKYIHIILHLAWKQINAICISSASGILVGATKDECIIKVLLHGMVDPSKSWLEIEIRGMGVRILRLFSFLFSRRLEISLLENL